MKLTTLKMDGEINQRLNFDEMSCDEEEDSSETGSGATTSTSNSGENIWFLFKPAKYLSLFNFEGSSRSFIKDGVSQGEEPGG